jgi:hypothetical protein
MSNCILYTNIVLLLDCVCARADFTPHIERKEPLTAADKLKADAAWVAAVNKDCKHDKKCGDRYYTNIQLELITMYCML